jgi:hypothetical protein
MHSNPYKTVEILAHGWDENERVTGVGCLHTVTQTSQVLMEDTAVATLNPMWPLQGHQ